MPRPFFSTHFLSYAILLQGKPGAGKTFLSYVAAHRKGLLDRTVVLDLENRHELLHSIYPAFNRVELRTPTHISEMSFETSLSQTYTNLKNAVTRIVRSDPEEGPKLVIVDGVSDARRIAHAAWCKENNRQHAVSPGDWGQVNDYEQRVLEILINWARLRRTQVIFTTLLKPTYENDQRTSETEPDARGWFLALVDEIYETRYEQENGHVLYTIKSPRGHAPPIKINIDDEEFLEAEE